MSKLLDHICLFLKRTGSKIRIWALHLYHICVLSNHWKH